MTPGEIVHAQFDAYNAQDVDTMCSFYADDCAFVDFHGAAFIADRAALHAHFTKVFAANPQNRSYSADRMTIGNIVVDHEVNQRSPEAPATHSVIVYVIRDGFIAHVAAGKPD